MIEDSVLKSLQSSFASSIQNIKIPSLGTNVFSFREANVREVKDIAKVVISNADSQSVVYASTLALIKQLSLNENIDFNKMTEVDRLRVLVKLLSNIFFSKNLSIRCPRGECDNVFSYSMKYGDLLKLLDELDTTDIVFENKTEIGDIKITANFPNVSKYLKFLEYIDSTKDDSKEYDNLNNTFSEIDKKKDGGGNSSTNATVVEKIKKRREVLKNGVRKIVKDGDTILGNVDLKSIKKEYSPLDFSEVYIKRIVVKNIKNSDDEYDIDMSEFDYVDSEKILSVFPAKLFIKEDGTDFLKYITKEIYMKMKKCVPHISCDKCGYEISKKLGLQNFFIVG